MKKSHIILASGVGVVALAGIGVDAMTDSAAQKLVQDNIVDVYEQRGFDVDVGNVSGSITGSAEIRKMTISRNNTSLTLKNITASNGEQSVGQVVFQSPENPSDSIVMNDLSIEGVYFEDGKQTLSDDVVVEIPRIQVKVDDLEDALSGHPAHKAFQNIGFKATWARDVEAMTTDLDVDVSLNDQAGIDFTSGMSNVPEVLMEPGGSDKLENMNPQKAEKLLGGLQVRKAEVGVWDESLMDALIEAHPRFEGRSAEDVRNMMAMQVQRTPYPSKYTQPVADFIQNSGSLKASLTPSSPVSISEFFNMGMQVMAGQSTIDHVASAVGFKVSS